MTIAIRRWKQDRVPAKLVIIALGGLILPSFVLQVVQMYLILLPGSSPISRDVIYWSLTFIVVFRMLLDTAFILVAIFARRPDDAPETK